MTKISPLAPVAFWPKSLVIAQALCYCSAAKVLDLVVANIIFEHENCLIIILILLAYICKLKHIFFSHLLP
jgi:hypothetical protein